MRSSTRLFTAVLLGLTALLVATISVYVLKLGKDASATVITALVGGVSALVAQGAVAIIKRNGSTDTQ